MPANEARTSCRPNSARRAAYRMALQGRDCCCCRLAMAWDGATGDNREAGSATLSHNVDVEICEEFSVNVIDGGCWSCNWSAKAAGITDQSMYWQVRPYSLPKQKVADAWRATEVRESAVGLPGWAARKAARHALGMPF